MIDYDPLPLRARRETACPFQIRFRGIDLTGADMLMQVRERANMTGDPLFSLSTVTLATDPGLRFVSVETIAGVKVSTIAGLVSKTMMTGLPEGPEVDSEYEGRWDLLMAVNAALNPGLSGLDQRYLGGPFFILPRVTVRPA